MRIRRWTVWLAILLVGIPALAQVPAGDPDPALQYLLTSLNDRDFKIRQDAAQDLARRGPAVVDAVAGVLKNGEPRARAGAAETLGLIKDERATDALISAIVDDGDAFPKTPKNTQVAIVAALGRQRNPRALDALMLAAHPDGAHVDVRTTALEALGDIGDPRAVLFLVRTLGMDMHPHGRDAAEASLRKFTGQDFGHDQRRWLKWIGENHPEWLQFEKPRGLHPGFRWVVWSLVAFGVIGFGAVIFGWRNVR